MLKVKGLAEGQDMSHVDNSQVCGKTKYEAMVIDWAFSDRTSNYQPSHHDFRAKRWALPQSRTKHGARIVGVRRHQFLPRRHPGGKGCANPPLAQHLALGLLVKF